MISYQPKTKSSNDNGEWRISCGVTWSTSAKTESSNAKRGRASKSSGKDATELVAWPVLVKIPSDLKMQSPSVSFSSENINEQKH